MTAEKKTRREFLTSGTTVLGASFMAANMPFILAACEQAQDNQLAVADYANITAEQGIELSAIADQIFPEDESPGATQIGAVYFIDAAFGTFMASALPMLSDGLDDLNKKASAIDARADRFSKLSLEQQTHLLQGEEQSPFFGMLQFLTTAGVFCLPRYGGNKDYAGWELLGFDHQHAWQPPFGYYDAAIHQSANNKGDDHDGA
jgi:hypothetical protein